MTEQPPDVVIEIHADTTRFLEALAGVSSSAQRAGASIALFGEAWARAVSAGLEQEFRTARRRISHLIEAKPTGVYPFGGGWSRWRMVSP